MFSAVQIFLGVLLVAASNAKMDPNDPNVQACFKENGLDVEKIQELLPHGGGDLKPEMRCVMKCMWEKDGDLKADGTLDLEHVEARLKRMMGGRIQPEKIPDILECAKKIDKIETCEDMAKIKECYHQFIQPQ